MDFSRSLTADLPAIAWRVATIGGLVALSIHLLATTRNFASVAVLAAAALLLVSHLRKMAARPPRTDVAAARPERIQEARQLVTSLALLDAVAVALFAVSPSGEIRLANRAARALCGGGTFRRIGDIPLLGGEPARTIMALPIGGRQLVSLADGRSMLVWIGAFSTPEEGHQRLVSLQAVAGQLDAVQVGAWHAMTRVLAHEMMNALTPIASLSESLAKLLAPPGGVPELASAAETIARQSRHLMSFVDRYHSIVNLPEPDCAQLDLAAFAADLATLARARVAASGATLALSLPPGDVVVAADAALLSRALLNLIANAADAVENAVSKEVRLKVSCAGGDLLFAVEDDGIGVPPERLEEIFVPFFTTKEGGAGIGLALARQIALGHGGELTATPRDGGGMTFTLSIPGARQLATYPSLSRSR